MPPCQYGSHIKPSIVDQQFWVDAGQAVADISGYIPGIGPFLGAIQRQLIPSWIDLTVLCAAPPAAPPVVDLQQLFLSGEWAAIPQWFVDWFWALWQERQWNTFCECLSHTGPCPPLTIQENHHFTGNGQRYDMYFQVPPTHTSATIAFKFTGPGGSNVQFAALRRVPPDVASVTLISQLCASGTQYNNSWTWTTSPATATILRLSATTNTGYSGGADCVIDVTVNWAGCTTTDPGTPFVPSPPPTTPTIDPPPISPASCTTDELCKMLAAIASQLGYTRELVTLMQRYAVPFGYVPGPAHPGLSGSGTLPISGLVGVRTDITSALPPKHLEGTPQYIWDVGWMSIMTPEGMIDEKRITRDTQIWQPRIIQEATTFGYFFKTGVVATVTELQPEPF